MSSEPRDGVADESVSGGEESRRGKKTSRARERARMNRWELVRRRASDLWHNALDLTAFWVILLLFGGTWAVAPRGSSRVLRVEEGTIASVDYEADRNLLVPDEATTRSHRQAAEQEILPVYDFDPGVQRRLDDRLSELFAAGRAMLPTPEELAARESSAAKKGAGSAKETADPTAETEEVPAEADLFEALTATTDLELTRGQVELLAGQGFSQDLEDRLRALTGTVLRRGVVSNQKLLLENRVRGVTLRNLQTGEEEIELDLYDYLGYPDELRNALETSVRGWRGLGSAERREMVDLLLSNLEPNLLLNRSETLDRKSKAAEAVGEVFQQVREGQVIVRKGDAIEAAAARAINSMAGEHDPLRQILPVLGSFLLLALASLALWLGIQSGTRRGGLRRLTENSILLLLTLVGTRFGLFIAEAMAGGFESAPFAEPRSYFYALPFAALGLLAALLYGRNLAILLSLVLSILVGQTVGGWAVLYVMVGSLSAVFLLERHPFRTRSSMIGAGLVVGLANAVTILLLAALEPGSGVSAMQVGFDSLCGLAGGITTAAVVSFAVPLFESLFGITTSIKLVELANTNLPLLQRLALEAPGTFQHSLMVANLARAGCKEIGGDAVLAYTGALYHDIGKVLRPEYFIENQRPGHNRHDKLAPTMSALILINHVKEGLELARSAHLPVPILDAIEQHHGNRLISFFYSRACERNDPETGAVREEEFRYPGPCPSNRVMGVLMLADGVEAASRSLADPSPARLRSVVRKIFEDCLQDGQLDDTDLTLRDLERLRTAFLRVLGNAFHRRVDYPGFDFREERTEKRLQAARAS